MSAVSRIFRSWMVIHTVIAMAVAAVVLWSGFQMYAYLEENAIVAALLSQGVGVQQSGSCFGGGMAGCSYRPRDVALMAVDTPVDLTLASGLRGVYSIDVTGATLCEDDVLAIASMTRLQWVALDKVNIPRSIWRILPQLEHLTSLFLRDVDVKDAGVTEIANARGLTRLYLLNCNVSDKGLASLGGLSELRILGLSHSRFSANALRQLKSLAQLESLTLTNCGLTDDSLEMLTSLESLSDVNLTNNAISDRGFLVLSKLNLYSINLDYSQVSDAGLRAFADARKGRLPDLSVKGTSVTEAGIAKYEERRALGYVER